LQRKGYRILLDAEVLVKLAYLTISKNTDLKSLETLRLSYEQGENSFSDSEFFRNSLDLTPLDELRRLCEQVLEASGDAAEE